MEDLHNTTVSVANVESTDFVVTQCILLRIHVSLSIVGWEKIHWKRES